MPYKIKGKCVYRKDTGEKVGCSNTAAKAKRYLKALYAAEDEEAKEKTFDGTFRSYMKEYKLK